MCGIIGATAQRDVGKILIEGLKRLEYRGYDSAGLAIIDNQQNLCTIRKQGKVQVLQQQYLQDNPKGLCGIAHTRWATHGVPSDSNSHPHTSDHISVVHNGIIENYKEIKANLEAKGYQFISDTDTEVIPHLIHSFYQGDLLKATQSALQLLNGAYAIAVISSQNPNEIVATRHKSPLLVGKGVDEYFVASDTLALKQVTDRFAYLEEGDVVHLQASNAITCYDASGATKNLEFNIDSDPYDASDKGEYRHFMDKEIHQQPEVVKATIAPFLTDNKIIGDALGYKVQSLLKKTKAVQIVACGSSYFAALVMRYWLEDWGNMLCRVEIASEYIYRDNFVPDDCLILLISQSGETADTLSALRKSKDLGYVGSLAICNVPNSTLVREADATLLTKAGFEVSVASTKAFVTQLALLQVLAIRLATINGMTDDKQHELVTALQQLPQFLQQVLTLEPIIEKFAEHFVNENDMLFLGRGAHYPIACEGALKMKEISYIHAESYAAGELKHGPLALIDEHMPVIAVSPNDGLIEKLRSNLKEVEARGGKLYVISDEQAPFSIDSITMPKIPTSITPIVYTLPLQMLSYQVAVIRGNDVDQPRNLAKSVTVE